jgi:hypothetical protein
MQVDQVNTLTLGVLERGKLEVDIVNTLTLGVLEVGKLVPNLDVGHQLQVDHANTLTLGVLEWGKLVPGACCRQPVSGRSCQHSYPWCSGAGEAGIQLAVGHQFQVDHVNILTLGVLERGKLESSLLLATSFRSIMSTFLPLVFWSGGSWCPACCRPPASGRSHSREPGHAYAAPPSSHSAFLKSSVVKK